ncbi:o-succinylbenzoate synthase [Algoriphagus ratkowskyi]|uniref:O-succinylbenzoate synthase n=1 Tax=Algoriphagus ratkowskyi TaxID=57028 RepID=A0A2W7RAU8_9BACT|nr:o-succinylbenzoate synthase [Algoriphagus ratkowskyi]PZX57634.1 o-succinylbenzoate synthase [Algoriphagus ratkowskyi]TXD78905.1 o-succinylbenzoate synthase [Algoriphagus ratkowskyi]
MSDSSKITFKYLKRTLKFKFDAGTSRGILKTKDVFWIKAFYTGRSEIMGWGEAAPLVNLSLDDREDFEEVLRKTLEEMSQVSWRSDDLSILNQLKSLIPFELPSIRFGLETAILDLKNGGQKKVLGKDFYAGKMSIPINGLIWMGEKDFMLTQINEKLAQGFDCIKMKIGAIDFQQELELLKYIRDQFSKDQITLRVDANGAFSKEDALNKLEQLANYDLHSIEQPIAAGNWQAMKQLCATTPLPIALDEELIGVINKTELLDQIQPHHIILKPTLLGGILETMEWIKLAEDRKIGWWMTSALESNIGLNAIAQLADSLEAAVPQGLGTGQLYQNNLDSPLEIQRGMIHYNPHISWTQPS